MPESKVRKAAASKARVKRHEAQVAAREERARLVSPGNRRWVPWAFITVGLLGGLWLVVYYIAGTYIPPMAKLGAWNMAIGMGLLACAFVLATLWK